MNLLQPKSFPILTTSRLQLRKPTLKDASVYHLILSCPHIGQYSDLPFKPTEKRSKQYVKWMSTLQTRGIGIAWIVCINDQPDIVGSIRINSIETKAQCGLLGYELHPDCWGNGYATEALAAVVSYAHNELSLNRLEAWVGEGNDASERVLVKNGFQLEGVQREKVKVRDHFQNVKLFGRLARDTLLAS